MNRHMTYEFVVHVFEVCGIMSAALLLVACIDYYDDTDTGIYEI